MPSSAAPRSPRRFLRFSLRTLLLIMTLCAAGVGFYRAYLLPRQRQLDAAKSLLRKNVLIVWQPSEPAWLRHILRIAVSDEMLSDCIAIHAERRGVNDEDLAAFRQLPFLERLYLARNPITDQGLRHLRGLKRLERLSLWGTPITDDGLQHLGGLESLIVLDIHDPARRVRYGSIPYLETARPTTPANQRATVISAGCLRHLAPLKNLQELHFSFPLDDAGLELLAQLPSVQIGTLLVREVTGTGLAELARWPRLHALRVERATIEQETLRHLGKLPALQFLWLEGAEAPEEAWQHLGDLTRLRQLSLQGSSIGDRGMNALGQLKSLQTLDLAKTRITDQGVSHLANLSNLRGLNLLDTTVTADCLSSLARLPQLETLHFAAPLDDEAVRVLAGMSRLSSLMTGRNGYAECYLTDTGLADLPRLLLARAVYIRDGRDGSGVAGIDLPPSSAGLSDDGFAQFLRNCQPRSVMVSGQDLTAACLRWAPELRECARVTLNSSKPAAETITKPLDTGGAAVEFNRRDIRISARGGGPRQVAIGFSRDDADLSLLRYLPATSSLKVGNLDPRGSAENEWDNLRFVPDLESFEMPGAHFSNMLLLDAVAIRHLAAMKKLHTLKCCVPIDFPADDLAPLGELKNLKSLDLICGRLGDEHLRAIARLENLLNLNIRGQPDAQFENQDVLRHLAELKQLHELQLNGVSDQGLVHLAQIESVARLYLTGRGLTDAGLRHLDPLPWLEALRIQNAGTTQAGIEAFRLRHPGVHVWSSR